MAFVVNYHLVNGGVCAMISCKIVLANTSKDESIIISPEVRRFTAELSASMDRNLLLRFNDAIILVVHSQVLAYYSTRFFDNYRLNRNYMKIKSDAHIARNLIQFHYTGILQLPFYHIEKYLLIANQLAFNIALEALSQFLEKFSYRNSYHAIICANIACESNNHVAAPCLRSIISCAATFLKRPISSDLFKMYASPNAVYRILQIFTIFTDWKKSLKLALDWIVYEEWRYCYADFILDAIVFEASDELIWVVKDEIGRLPGKISEILAKRCKYVMYRYSENNIERTNQEKYSLFSAEDSASPSIRSSTPSMRSFAYSEIKTSSITQDSPQSPSWSSETENLILSACSSTSIFDEFLLDDITQQTDTPNNAKSLTPMIHSTNLISHEKLMKRQQANLSQLSAGRMEKYSQESKISHQLRNEENSRISNKSQGNYSEIVAQEVAKETIISEIANNEDQLAGSESESDFDKVLLSQCALSKVEALSCFDEPPFHFPNYINIDCSWEKDQSEMVRRQKIAQKQKLTEEMGYLNKFGFVVDANLSDNAITI